MKKMMAGLLGAALALSAMPAAGAVVYTVQNGKLVSATGVMIGQSTYKVTFFDDTCTVVFGGCSADRFDFKTEATARAAGDALLNQVLVGTYATSPGSVFGCGTSTCDSYIPYTIYDADTAQAVVVLNRGTGNRSVRAPAYPGANISTALDPNVNYVRFTVQAAAVPEPATWATMMLGAGLVGAAGRYRRRTTTIVSA